MHQHALQCTDDTPVPVGRAAGRAGPCTVGLWIEMSDASLADGHGEGLIRWTRALIGGLDALPDVKAIVIPCQRGSERLMSALFADDPAGEPPRLLSPKLEIVSGRRSRRLIDAAQRWVDRKRRRALDRLAAIGVSAKPSSWLHALLRLTQESPSSLGLIIMMLGRLWKMLTAAAVLGLMSVARPVIYRWRSAFESLAHDFSRRGGIDAWIVPNPGWSAAAGLPGHLIVNVADIVYREFPLPDLKPDEIERHGTSLRRLAERAESVVCFSRHVADRQVRPVLEGVARQIAVVPHAPFRTRPCRLPREASRLRLADDLRRHFCLPKPHRYFCDFPFEQVDYLLISSKCRPYKNYAAVLHAYEDILRRHRRDLKLIVTGHLSGNPELAAILHSHGLVFDVIEATNLPEDVHTRLIQHARGLIIPTLFEGALPFGFAEAVSLGTPVAMARIPVVEEVIAAGDLAAAEYFNPGDLAAMIRSILHVLDDPGSVLDRQRRIVAELEQRTWVDVAADYLALTAPLPIATRSAKPPLQPPNALDQAVVGT